MPHIYINEKDNTRAGSIEENTNVVYIPGAIEAGGTMETNVPTMFATTREFLAQVTGSESGTISNTNLNAIMAKELISLGMVVLFESFGTHNSITTTGTETVEDAIAKLVNWDKLTDKGLYKVKFLTCGAASAFQELTSSTVAAEMIKAAAKRGDCIALIDHEKTITAASGETIAQTIHDKYSTCASAEGAKFAAAFTPWCKFALGSGLGSLGGLALPGSFAFLSAYAKSVKNNPNWYAAAGFSRGQVPSIIEPLYRFGDADAADLQGRVINDDGSFGDSDNTTWAVNPISKIDVAGFIVWGNRTLLDNSAAGGLTASSFLNIRNLCCDIKKTLYRAARKYTFEQNNDILWINFCSEITPLLDRALSGNGIRGYRMTQITTNIKGRLKALIEITPIEAVEDFELTVAMEDSLEDITESV